LSGLVCECCQVNPPSADGLCDVCAYAVDGSTRPLTAADIDAIIDAL